MTLTNQQTIALQSRQMLGDARPRSTHQVREVTMADRNSQKRAPRIRYPEISTQFQQRQSDSLVKIEAQEAGAAQ